MYVGIWGDTLKGPGRKNKKDYPWPWPSMVAAFQDGKIVGIVEYNILEQTGQKYFIKYFLNKKNYQLLWSRWERWVLESRKIISFLEAVDVKRLSDKDLLLLYEITYVCMDALWCIVHIPEIANWGGEKILYDSLKKIDANKAEDYLETLSALTKLSFTQQEELDLLRLALIKNKKKRLNAFLKHAELYRLLLSNYAGSKILSEQYFEKKVKRLSSRSDVQKRIRKIEGRMIDAQKKKRALVKNVGLSKNVQFTAEQLSNSIWWQDLRKMYIWRMQFYTDKLVKEIAWRNNWKFNDIVWCWPWEVTQLAQRQKLDYKKIISRAKVYCWVSGKEKVKEYYGKQAESLLKKYDSRVSQSIKEVRGLVVSRGNGYNVRGAVKIIRDPFKDQKKMKKGDILVAPMTSPEFVILMRKAAAVVTDTGGMTSHAAVVSRELGIPCLVRTGAATKVFKDGDIVEVNTKTGTVKKV